MPNQTIDSSADRQLRWNETHVPPTLIVFAATAATAALIHGPIRQSHVQTCANDAQALESAAQIRLFSHSTAADAALNRFDPTPNYSMQV